MHTLFTIDLKNYNINGTKFERSSARAIIIKDGKLAMIHSLKYDYYKFPGGGIKNGEEKETALAREVLEEARLCVIKDSIKEYGMVHRIQKVDVEDVFIQDNFYYFCDVSAELQKQNLDDYEADETCTLALVDAKKIIETNVACTNPKVDKIILQRESRVTEMLVEEGFVVVQ